MESYEKDVVCLIENKDKIFLINHGHMKLLRMNKYMSPDLLLTVSTGLATSGTSLDELSRRNDSTNEHIVIYLFNSHWFSIKESWI